MRAMLPRRRDKGLVVEALDDETIVYDTGRHKAHCLNRVASLVWSRCDGRTTVEAMARDLHVQTGMPADEDLVRRIVDELGQRGLLEGVSHAGAPRATRPGRPLLSRRTALCGLSTSLIMTITAPEAAAAASCVGRGGLCYDKGVFTPCCPGLTCSDVRGSKIRCQ